MMTAFSLPRSDASFPRPADVGSPGYFCLWHISGAFLLGLVAFASQQESLVPPFFVLGYGAVVFAFIRAVVMWRDLMNPLSLLLIVGFLRFFAPGLMMLSGAQPPDEVGSFFEAMQLAESEWLWGHVLALIGIHAAIVGWLSVRSHGIAAAPLKIYLADGTKFAAMAAMAVGFMALAGFFLMNASLGAILSGSFRGTTVQVGSGKYFFLAYLLIVGGVFLCCYLLAKGYKWPALIPVAIAMIAYWPLGGRGRALVSLLAGVILLWYVNRERDGWRRVGFTLSRLCKLPIAVIFVTLVFYVGSHYRGQANAGAQAEALSVAGLSAYLSGAIYTDLGQLHSLAGAVAIGPGVLGGQTFWASLSWPLSTVLPIPGRSAGVYIVDVLAGFPDEHRWGVNATLIGDAYLNFGLAGVVVVMAIYGALLKIIYLKFRQGRLHGAVYVLAAVYGMQMLWGSIEVWPQAVVVLGFALGIALLGETVFKLRLTGARLGLAANGERRS